MNSHLMAFSTPYPPSCPLQSSNPLTISFHTQAQSSSHVMDPFSSSSIYPSSSSLSSFTLDFQQPDGLYQQEQQQQQNSPSPSLSPSPSPSSRPLQGPRPSRLKIDKSSHKIKKPPAAPAALARPTVPPQTQLQPVIIYTVSPKVIRTKASDFMALVQRLTGVNSSPTAVDAAMASSAASPASAFPCSGDGALSPAANLAAIEKATQMVPVSPHQRFPVQDLPVIEQHLDPTAPFTLPFPPTPGGGILSPNPAALPQLSSCLFSSPDPSAAAAAAVPEVNSVDLLQDMMAHVSSPAFPGLFSFGDGTFVSSPHGISFTPTSNSPLWDFMHNSPQPRIPDDTWVCPPFPDL